VAGTVGRQNWRCLRIDLAHIDRMPDGSKVSGRKRPIIGYKVSVKPTLSVHGGRPPRCSSRILPDAFQRIKAISYKLDLFPIDTRTSVIGDWNFNNPKPPPFHLPRHLRRDFKTKAESFLVQFHLFEKLKCTEFLGVEILLFCCCWFIRFLVLGKGGFVAGFAFFPNRPRGGGSGNHLLELHRAAVVQ